MNPELIQAELRIKGTKAADIARERNVSKALVSYVIHGIHRSRPTEERIAEITGIPLKKLWPQWYGKAA